MHAYFRKPDHALDRLSDDALIAYLHSALDAGDAESAATALAILVFGFWGSVQRRVAMKVPKEDVEDVAAEVVSSAIRSAFDGTSVGEFHSWLSTILARRVADYHRSREGKPTIVSLYGADDGARDVADPSADNAVEVRDVIDQALATLSDDHRRVATLYLLDGYSAREVAEQVPGMSEANVHKIAERLRTKLRRELRAGDTEVR